MEEQRKQYIVRDPIDFEKEKYTYLCRDEKGIVLGVFKPFQLLDYRGYTIPIYCDEPGQQYFVRFEDDEWSNPNCYYDDFCDFIDSKLDFLLPKKTITMIENDLNTISYQILQLGRLVGAGDSGYKQFKLLQKDITKYLELLSLLLNKVVVKDNDMFTYGNVKYLLSMREDMIFSDTVLDQIKRIQQNKLKGE